MRELVVRLNLAGAMIWSVDTDDFQGDCGPDKNIYADFGGKVKGNLTIPRRSNQNYKLLRTINEAIIVATEELKLEEESTDNDKGTDNDKDNEIDTDGEKDKGVASSIKFSLFVLMINLVFVNLLKL
jgi:hypothetical protein